MKQRKPLRRISLKRQKILREASGNNFLGFNSTIARKPRTQIQVEEKTALKFLNLMRDVLIEKAEEFESARKPCNAITAGKKLSNANNFAALHSASREEFSPIAGKSLRSSFGLKRKPVNKQSVKQKSRLKKLAEIRQNWWNESQARGKPLICGICDEEIRTREELVSDHEIPGTFRDDRFIQPAHGICNQIKGSRRNFKIVRGDRNWKLIHGLL